VDPGVYDIAEIPVAGWTQAETDPQCSNGDPASEITLAAFRRRLRRTSL